MRRRDARKIFEERTFLLNNKKSPEELKRNKILGELENLIKNSTDDEKQIVCDCFKLRIKCCS